MKCVTFSRKGQAARIPAAVASRGGEKLIRFADADIRLDRQFLPAAKATTLMLELRAEVAWQQDTLTLFGKKHLLPRLHQWYGDAGTSYRWSGIQMNPNPWLPVLVKLRRKIEMLTRTQFNCVLINLYRDGNDSMRWHADNEAVLGEQPVIASISLGAERDLLLRKQYSRKTSQRIALTHGSLLIMAGDTQRNWQHALPRRKYVRDSRINLTFRYIKTSSLTG